ncbi:hypothetical protein WH47_03344 [Habropoda laboriosa]|uniref:Uncharacterized protein n=1 Tax=Habropoda laboriosa TaxID=597456 RepID=A0A0L7RBP4_9HYME|nr:hypothetical protein WH47_03344 [Habropoda laboriosa]
MLIRTSTEERGASACECVSVSACMRAEPRAGGSHTSVQQVSYTARRRITDCYEEDPIETPCMVLVLSPVDREDHR